MIKILTSQKRIGVQSKKYCRIILTEDKPTSHRLVETSDGRLEYRMGTGKNTAMTVRGFRNTIRSIVQAAKSHQLENIAIQVSFEDYPKLSGMGATWFFQTLAINLTIASYEFTEYKTTKKTEKKLREILVCNVATADKKIFENGLTIAKAISTTRDVANTSGEDMTPSKLVTATKVALKGTRTTVTVLDTVQIKKEKMGLLEAVGKGATDKPKFIVIEYWGNKKPTAKTKTQKSLQPIILIGKGITYDTGGLNVKPSGSMHEMHLDMAGGASVLGAIQAIAKLGLKKNVIGLIPAAENAVSAASMRAGDIATSMSGQTVEILHTDAEGRLVLADALTYAQKHYEPKLLIDVATLTGAALVALGQHASAVMTKHKTLQDKLVEIGEETGDLTWPLPLWDEYKQYLRSSRADLANIATNFSRYGGSIEGGTFLSFFVNKKLPWAHIDIAPRMNSVSSDKLAKGATGEPVQLLVELVKKY